MEIVKINDIVLEMLDTNIYRLRAVPIIFFDKKDLTNIKKHYKEELEKETGLKVIRAYYQICPCIDIEAFNLLPLYYLVDKKQGE